VVAYWVYGWVGKSEIGLAPTKPTSLCEIIQSSPALANLWKRFIGETWLLAGGAVLVMIVGLLSVVGGSGGSIPGWWPKSGVPHSELPVRDRLDDVVTRTTLDRSV